MLVILFLTTQKNKNSSFPQKCSVWSEGFRVSVTEGETAFVRVPDSDSTQASLFTEHFSGVICFTGDWLCVCACQKKKRTFQCDPSCNGLPKHMCLCVSCPNHLMRLEAIFFWVHQKCQMHFYKPLTFWNVRKIAFHMVLLSFKVK